MPKGKLSEPFKLELSSNYLTRATVRAHCDPKFLRTQTRLGIGPRSDQRYKGSTVFVDSERACEKFISDIRRERRFEGPKFLHALEQWPSAKKVIEQRASYTDRYNTNYEEILHGPVPTTHWTEAEKFTDAVAYFFCLANEEIPPRLFEELLKPFGDDHPITDKTKQALMLDFEKYTHIKGFRRVKGVFGCAMEPVTRKEVAHRIVMLLKEAVKNEETRHDLMATAGEASGTCEDRAAFSLFEREQVMFVNKAIAEYSSAASEPEKQYQQQKLLSMFKEIALIKVVEPFALDEVGKRKLPEWVRLSQDDLETVLSFYVALRNLGYISFGPNKMHFNYILYGGFSFKEVSTRIPDLLAKAKSEDVYEIAAKIPEWEAFMINHDPECKRLLDDALATRAAVLDALYDGDPEAVREFKHLFSEQRGFQGMSDQEILEAADNEYLAAKSEALVNRSHHFFRGYCQK